MQAAMEKTELHSSKTQYAKCIAVDLTWSPNGCGKSGLQHVQKIYQLQEMKHVLIPKYQLISLVCKYQGDSSLNMTFKIYRNIKYQSCH